MTTEGHDAGDKEILAVKIRVVPGPDPGIDLAVVHALRIEFPEQLAVQFVEDR